MGCGIAAIITVDNIVAVIDILIHSISVAAIMTILIVVVGFVVVVVDKDAVFIKGVVVIKVWQGIDVAAVVVVIQDTVCMPSSISLLTLLKYMANW